MAILKTGTTVGGEGVVVGILSQTFTTSASSNTFTLSNSADSTNVFVTVGGIVQAPTLNYIVSGTTLQLANTDPLVAGVSVEVKYLQIG